MPFTEKRLAGPTTLAIAPAALYTVPSSKTAIVKQVIVTNTTSSAASFILYIGAASSANSLFNQVSVPGNDAIVINLSQVLATGEVLRANASVNSALNITVSGVENDGPIAPNTTYLADQSVTTAKIADSAVTTDKIAPLAVVNADIAAGAVTSDKTSFTDTNFAGTVTTDLALVDGTSYPGISHVQMRILPSSNNVGAGISMQATGAGARGWSIVSTGPSAGQGAGALLLYRDTSDGSSASLWLDTNGRVRTPNQPAFRYHGFTADTNGLQGGSAPLNVGSHLSIGSGGTYSRFTAPVAGVYVFGFSVLINEIGGRLEAAMRKNGSTTIDGYSFYAANDYANATNAYSNAVNTYILSLAANDYVDWYVAFGTQWGDAGRGDRQFWGYLLG